MSDWKNWMLTAPRQISATIEYVWRSLHSLGANAIKMVKPTQTIRQLTADALFECV